MRLRKFDIFEKYSSQIIHALACRDLDLDINSNEARKNYQQFCDQVGVELNKMAVPIQTHSDNIVVIDEAQGFDKRYESTDAFITNKRGVVLSVRFADCQPVMMFDPVKKVIAAVHSGWRGNAQNIIGKTLKKMKSKFHCNPKDILVGLGPSLGPCCAEFSDPLSELPQEMHRYVNEQNYVDLWGCAYQQICDEEVPDENIEIMRVCTACNTDSFFSYRAEKAKTGRMVAVISMS